MAGNPFHYGTPVEDEHFAGREAERRALVARMTDRINVVLASPRRYGKTSLLLLAEREVREDRAAVVHVNLLRCRDEADLAGRLTSSAYALPGGRWHRAAQAVGEFVRRLRVSPTVTFSPEGTPVFGFAGELARADADAVISDVYGLLAAEAERRPAVLVLDEFQAITELGEHLPGLLKALADEHPSVALVLAGSRAHLMDRLTASSGAPLYGMAERLSLGPVGEDDMIAYLTRRAHAGGKPMTADVASLVLHAAGPVPNDIQRLAYAAFEVADTAVTAPDVAAGLAQSAAHDAATYADILQRLTGAQRRVLEAIAAGEEEQVFSARFARAVDLASGASVARAITTLAEQELLVQRARTWMVSDPFFRFWLTDPLP